MPAVPVAQEAKAFAGAIVATADADVVQRPQPKLVDLEAAAADLAGDLVQPITRGRPADASQERADAAAPRRAEQADDALAGRSFGHRSGAGRDGLQVGPLPLVGLAKAQRLCVGLDVPVAAGLPV